MRTIPKILDYERILEPFNSPKNAHAQMIHKTSGTKVTVVRDLSTPLRNGKRRHKFNVAQDKMRALMIEMGV